MKLDIITFNYESTVPTSPTHRFQQYTMHLKPIISSLSGFMKSLNTMTWYKVHLIS